MNNHAKTPASRIAFGGVMAALSVVLMCLGGLIPVATYTTPMLCAVLLQFVLSTCGLRIGWAWFAAVSILSMLLSPDKEAAGVFLFLGYYPIIRPWIERKRIPVIWKLLFFNISAGILYWILLAVFGLDNLSAEFEEMNRIMLALFLVLGNVAFFLFDYLLGMKRFQRKR